MSKIFFQTDEELVQRVRDQGDNRAFSLLNERYFYYSVKKCRAFRISESDAIDLTQEVFIKVFLNINGFRKEATFKTWINSIITNTCIDFLRKNRNRHFQQILTEQVFDTLADEYEELDNEILYDAVVRLIEELPLEDKTILLLKYKEGHTIKEIQLALHLNESAVKMRLKRARERLIVLYDKLNP